MGFGDKLKDLRKQAQDAVAENSEKIHTALDAAAIAANEKTGGKHAQRIVKFGEKASGAVDKFGAGAGDGDAAPGSAETAQPARARPGVPDGRARPQRLTGIAGGDVVCEVTPAGGGNRRRHG